MNVAYGQGISAQYGGSQSILFNTIHNAGGSGISIANNPDPTGLTVRGNLVTKCGRYGIEIDTPGLAGSAALSGNAYGGGDVANTLGNKYRMDDDGTANPVDAYLTYRYAEDVTTAGDPYQNVASGDYRLNTAAGGALTGTGPYRDWPSLMGIGGMDFGAVQTERVTSGTAQVRAQERVIMAITIFKMR